VTHDQRRSELRRMKMLAAGLLAVAAIVFVFARIQEQDNSSWGYVRATAEAAMVGALADWFAVTALFRHPLGLPIPHTAIIKKRKDQIGQSMGTFVRDNFLSREVVTERLAEAEIGKRVGGWLAEPENARALGDQSAAVVRGLTEVMRDEAVQGGLDDLVAHRIRAIPVTPFVGRAVDVAVEGEHHQMLLDATLAGLSNFLNENQQTFRTKFYGESPWWVPEQVDDVVFDKIYEVAVHFITDIVDQQDHPVRGDLELRARDLAARLKSSPDLIARGEQLKEELLAHPEVRAWSASLWERIKSGLIEATADPESELRKRLEEALVDAGRSIAADPQLRSHIDGWVTDATGYVAEQFRGEIAGLVATTVQGWDADETADLFELQVGRDLQFIRINGTIVGGLAGLGIFSLSELFL
jgi:uncharacterized membrane-anchored protein YjiN (DUF445 family)